MVETISHRNIAIVDETLLPTLKELNKMYFVIFTYQPVVPKINFYMQGFFIER